ncbi:MAG: tyrosine--tRNA ligase [Bacteroidetes bacterium]|nr:MAG: tyrosine--tRNA ligase [Bacteroidota bacterium]
MNFIEELRWRGMIHDSIPGTEEFLNENKVSGYIGFDPTADSLHVGNLVPIMMLKYFQQAGHTPVALVGGATGMVGDPSGKSEERQFLSEEVLRYNQECIHKQLTHFLDFDPAIPNPARMVNNYDWFKDIGFLQFLRDIGKHITINYMMAKDSVKKRLEGDSGISYTEFAYQLLQGYDFLHLYQHEQVRIQMGGSDQWGNLTTGTYLISKKLGKEAKAFAVTCPLLTRADGQKFGKSAAGENIWLDPKKTSPYQFYQYWINTSDEDAEKFLRIFSLRGREEQQAIVQQHQEDPGRRQLQKTLAADITLLTHGQEALDKAIELSNFLFSRNTTREALQKLSLDQWEEVSRQSTDTISISRSRLEGGINIVDLLVELGITQSKGEARRSIEKDRSIRINTERWEDSSRQLNMQEVFHNRYFQIQKGKKQRFIVKVVE